MLSMSFANDLFGAFMTFATQFPAFFSGLFAASGDIGSMFTTGTNNLPAQGGPIIKFIGICVMFIGVGLGVSHLFSDPPQRKEYLIRGLWCVIGGGAAWLLGAKFVSGLGNGVGNTVKSVFGI